VRNGTKIKMSFESEKAREKAKKDDKPKVRITQQFRERANMAYDLDCSGSRITVRVFETPKEPQAWRVEARTSDTAEAVAGHGGTRADAFHALTLSWVETALTRGLPTFDWEAIGRAMTAVRAL
jgi:hypothetical protein